MSLPEIKDPVIIIGCPRSGTTLLFTILSQSPELFSMYRESWNVLKGAYMRSLLPADAPDDSLSPEDLSDEAKKYILEQFHKYSVNNESLAYWSANHLKIPGVSHRFPVPNLFAPILKNINSIAKDIKGPYRLLEKTPRNCFRVAFMDKLFPDAKFVFISRQGPGNISSLMEGWRRNAGWLNHSRFPKEPKDFKMSNFDYKKWEYVLPPGWQDFDGKTLEEVCAHQWISSNKYALDELEQMDQNRVYKLRYEDLTSDPASTIEALSKFLGIAYEGKLKTYAEAPPVVSTGFFEKPKKDKWKKNAEALERIAPMIEETQQRLGYATVTEALSS